MYFPILSCGIQKVGACLFPKQRWPAPRAFREKSTWFWCTSQGRHCHYGSYPGRKRSTANRQRNRTMDRHHGGMVKVCLKIPEQLGGLSSFVMFPYVSTFFQYVTRNVLNGVGLFCPDEQSGRRIFFRMILHACNRCNMYINMCITVYTYYVIWIYMVYAGIGKIWSNIVDGMSRL